MANSKGNRRRFGAVRKLPSGRYQARYPGPDGRMRPADKTFPDKTTAERWLVRKEAEILEGRWRDPDDGKLTVEQWGERWFAAASPELKPKTRALYSGLIRLWINPRLGSYLVRDVRPITVAEWIAGLRKAKLSASRIRTAYRVFAQIMQSAADNDLILMTPCRGIKLPRLPEPEPRILTDAEVERLVSATKAPHDLLVKLLVFAGLRIGEAFALRRSDVDVDGGCITIDESLAEISGKQIFDTPKNHQVRRITLPAFLVRDLARHLDRNVGKAGSALLFVGRTGKALHYNAWRTAHFDPAVESAGLKDVTPHALRATHATWVADRHGVMAAAARLGHSNASVTTRHYARAVDGRDAEIAKKIDAEHTRKAKAPKKPKKPKKQAPGDLAHNWHDGDDDGPAGALVPA
jgi:integrase